MLRRLGIVVVAVVALMWSATPCSAQHYVKLNGLYACVGIINPQVEFRLSQHSTFQTEAVYSPWQSINGHPMHFGIFLNEYRYFIKESNHGFYVAANAGLMAFKMSKPELRGGHIEFQNRYCKGYGYMLGLAIGYEHRFAERWIVDVFFGYSFMESRYNGYSMDGVIDMYPHRPAWKEPSSPDPFNGSSEWLPNKIGVSIGVVIFDPAKRR